MISLEQQCVSLELAKCLRDLGVKQESLFYWAQEQVGEDYFLTQNPKRYRDPGISAFTVAELGEILPNSILIGDTHYQQFTDRFHDKWLVGYPKFYEDDQPFVDTEADARARCLIYLVENRLLTGV